MNGLMQSCLAAGAGTGRGNHPYRPAWRPGFESGLGFPGPGSRVDRGGSCGLVAHRERERLAWHASRNPARSTRVLSLSSRRAGPYFGSSNLTMVLLATGVALFAVVVWWVAASAADERNMRERRRRRREALRDRRDYDMRRGWHP
jgi:hypothetical protein